MEAKLNRRDFLLGVASTAAGMTLAGNTTASVLASESLAEEAQPTAVMAPATEGLDPIPLPPPVMEGGAPLMDVIKARKSTRAFGPQPLTMEELSDLLWAAFGVNRPETGNRTAPSAMNAQEIDIYLVSAQGTHVYDARQNALTPVIAEDIRKLAGGSPFMAEAPLFLLYVADYSRASRWPVEKRAIYSGAHAGFIGQNVYLYCASRGLNTLFYEGFNRAPLISALGLREDQTIVFAQVVGYPTA